MTDQNQVADDAENPQPTDETTDEQQEAASESDQDGENAPEVTETDPEDESVDQVSETAGSPRGTGLYKQVADEAFRVRSVQGKQEECFALHRLELVLGELKAAVPAAVNALGDDNPDLTATLNSLLAVL